MDSEKIKIELNSKELELVNELNDLQNHISDLDAKNLNNDLMDSIKSESILTITNALGLSDIYEKRAYSNGLEADKDYKSREIWENTFKDKSSKKFKPKFVHKNELNRLDETKSSIIKYSKEERVKYEGKEFTDRKKELLSEGKPFSVKDGFAKDRILKFHENKDLKPSLEHVRPINEVHNDVTLNRYTSFKERNEYINSKENTTLTRLDINKSKNGRSLEKTPQWVEKNKERFNLDSDLIKEKIEITEKKRDKILKNKKITYKAKEKLEIAGANAIKSGAKAAVGQLLTITISETIDEFKKEDTENDYKAKVKNISIRIKQRASELMKTFKDFSINSFISTFLDALLDSLFKIFKNILKFIKTAFYSIMRAFKVLISKEFTKEEKLVECRKILGATVATLIGLALEEIIHKALISFPLTAPFAVYVSPVLAGLIVGIGSVLIMQGWEKYKDNIQLTKLKAKETLNLEKSKNISSLKAQISDMEVTESVKITFTIFQGVLPLISSFNKQIDTSLNNIRETSGEINFKLQEINKKNQENDDLLNLLESL